MEKAAEKELDWVYDRVFRMACEPSHITDLAEYMPRSDEAISLEPPKHSVPWALIALYHGTLLMCALLKSLSTIYCLGLDKRIAGVRDNLEGINRKAWEATVKS